MLDYFYWCDIMAFVENVGDLVKASQNEPLMESLYHVQNLIFNELGEETIREYRSIRNQSTPELLWLWRTDKVREKAKCLTKKQYRKVLLRETELLHRKTESELSFSNCLGSEIKKGEIISILDYRDRE